MRQAKATGGVIKVRLQEVSAADVLSNKRLKILGVGLGDWLACTKCNTQQIHHYQNGGDFQETCWNCGTSRYDFVYFDELARSVPPETTLYRLNRR